MRYTNSSWWWWRW